MLCLVSASTSVAVALIKHHIWYWSVLSVNILELISFSIYVSMISAFGLRIAFNHMNHVLLFPWPPGALLKE